jgi:aryl-alcohol dehydrogenase-like predicted oxidoreductase
VIALHNLVEPEEWDVAHGPNGAVEALARARDEGLCRFIGVTGHGLRIAGMHLRSLERFDFDSVLLPYNYLLLQDPSYRAEVDELLARCADRRVAVQTIKAIARRRWSGDEQPHYSWYEPLTDEDALARSVRFVLAQPGLFLNTSSDARLLRSILAAAAAASSGPTPSAADLEADVAGQAMRPLFDGADLERI